MSRAPSARGFGLGHSLQSDQKFLQLIFHELRTPLSSIHGYASLLLTGELGALAPTQRQTVERLQDLTTYLTTLITNLRQLALLADEPAILPWEPLDMPRLVRAVSHDLEAEANRKGVQLVLNLPAYAAPLWADRNGITQVLINLVMNAIKFTPPKGTVTVEISGSDKTMHLTVRDTGVGIPRPVVSKLFRTVYHQDRPDVGAVGGSGLGLIIVKRNVQRHRGTVSITSRVGRGTVVRVALKHRRGQDVLKTALAQLIERQRRSREPFSLLLLKGTGVPEEQLGGIVKESIRSDDHAYPIPQAQLIAIIATVGFQGAQAIRQRIEQRIQRNPELQHIRALKLQLGIASYPAHGRQPSQLLAVAQQRLTPVAMPPAGA